MQVFISHDLKDTSNLDQITQKLSEKGFDIHYNESLKTYDLDVFIFIVSENSVDSRKMKKEYDYCIQKHPKINIITIKLGKSSKLPLYLYNYRYLVVDSADELDYKLNIILNEMKKLTPPVFICHSSKDKKRFVTKFIENLKKYDVNPWYDDSEINGGNLIEKIDNAIRMSNCGIIIFSKNLKDSKFALRERDTLIKKSIHEDYTLIPVKIDAESELPQLINPLQIIEIKDLKNYEKELNTILQIVFGNNEKDFIETTKIQLPNCSQEETNIFLELCDLCMEHGFDIELDPENILNVCEKLYDDTKPEIIEEKLALSLKQLEKEEYLIDKGGNVGRAFSSKRVTSKGFCFYFKNVVEDHENKYLKLISVIINKISQLDNLVDKTNLDYNIVEAIIRIFRKKEYIVCKNDLTILGVTFKDEDYFKRITEK